MVTSIDLQNHTFVIKYVTPSRSVRGRTVLRVDPGAMRYGGTCQPRRRSRVPNNIYINGGMSPHTNVSGSPLQVCRQVSVMGRIIQTKPRSSTCQTGKARSLFSPPPIHHELIGTIP